jgi:dipeptidyl aminopeptidase/acylaminoacyl peptidase
MKATIERKSVVELFFGAVAILVVLGGSTAVAQDDVFTPQHVARVRVVTAAAVSPDGGRVAYVLGVPREPFKDDDGLAWAELHVVTADGASRPFVTGPVNVSAVDWRPDGKEISFLAKRGKDEFTSLYAIAADGGEARRVVTHKADITAYAWSPDGSQVAFLAVEPAAKEKKELKDKGFSQQIYEEDWQFVRVWIAPAQPSATGATSSEPRKLDLTGSASELRWSPAGDRLAVALAPSPSVDDGMMNRKVHILDASNGKLVRRIDNPGKLGQVAWSRDGKRLAIISAADRNDPQEGRLLVTDAGDSPLKDVLPNYAGHVTAIAWRTADRIVFSGDEGAWSTVGEIGTDGSNRTTHLAAGSAVLTGLTLSHDGRVAAWLGQSARHAPEVFVSRAGDKSPRRLTNSNPWLDKMRFAAQEVAKFKARDGLELEGVLVRPLTAEEGKRYPLILAVHGGPESHVPNGWVTTYSNPGQVAAARGFAVFYPNYRGSTGRGVEFSKLGQADAAGKEFDDLIDAVDHLVAVGLVDPKKVGITGGSYGGYASAWGATRFSDRFAASVMFVGISDNISKTGTTDIPNEMHLVHHRKSLTDDWKYFLERSPIYYVKQARTPLLILHGKDDPRVHPSQSLELFRQVKVLGQTPVRLVLYPGEGHGNRRAASRLDYNLRMMQWMEHYLCGPGGSPPPYELDYGIQK